MVRSYLSTFEPLLRRGEKLRVWPPTRNTPLGTKLDRPVVLHNVLNLAPFRVPFNLGALDAAAANAGASAEGARVDLGKLLRTGRNRLLQFRVIPQADFDFVVYQPNGTPHGRVLENISHLHTPFSAALDPRGNPMNEYFHLHDGTIQMQAINPHRRALPTTPGIITGWAYEMESFTAEEVLEYVSDRHPDRAPTYTKIYDNTLRLTKNYDMAAHALLLQMQQDRTLFSAIVDVESTFTALPTSGG